MFNSNPIDNAIMITLAVGIIGTMAVIFVGPFVSDTEEEFKFTLKKGVFLGIMVLLFVALLVVIRSKFYVMN